MIKAKHRFFTLLELLIVLCILSVVLGVVGLNLGSAARTESFRASVGTLVDKLRMAQDIMLILKTSVKVTLSQSDKGLSVSIAAEGALSPALLQATSEKIVIQEIKSFSFTEGDKVSTDKVTLDFLSSGTKMTKGTLVVGSGDLKEEIYLPGYPKIIKIGPAEADDEITPELIMELYPAEVRAAEVKRKEQKEAKEAIEKAKEEQEKANQEAKKGNAANKK
ncbi:MAG: hypothetical protein Q8K75_09110 [Chlamydiales bacterium]|nr:hypothetical protein [Chlamydiales bacterium]